MERAQQFSLKLVLIHINAKRKREFRTQRPWRLIYKKTTKKHYVIYNFNNDAS